MSAIRESILDALELVAIDYGEAVVRANALQMRRRQLIVELLRAGVPYAQIRSRLERPECGVPCTDLRRQRLENRLRKETERYRHRRSA